MFGAVVLLGAPYTLKRNEHVRVDVIYSNLSARRRLIVDAVGFLCFMLPVTIFIIYLSVPVFLRSFASGEMSMNAGGLILWPAKLLVPLGFSLLTLQGISELIKRVAALEGVIELETKYEKPLQ
jgi:TRAP-type mannitol/chloroaromatic compound transport system permease small subunit